MTTIGPVTHHINQRQTCSSCTTRVFAYADVLDTHGNITGHLCRMCANAATK